MNYTLCDYSFSLNFTFNPSSSVYNYTSVELRVNGEEEEVTLDNLEEYIESVTDFCLNSGIRRQMEALRCKYAVLFCLALRCRHIVLK